MPNTIKGTVAVSTKGSVRNEWAEPTALATYLKIQVMKTNPNQIPTTPAIPAALPGAGIGNLSNAKIEPTAIPVKRLRIIAFIKRSSIRKMLHCAGIYCVLQ